MSPTYRKGGGAAADASTRLQQAFSLFEARGVNERDEKARGSVNTATLHVSSSKSRVGRAAGGRTPDRAVRCSAAYSMRAAAATASTVRATASTPPAVLARIKKKKAYLQDICEITLSPRNTYCSLMAVFSRSR